MEDKTIKIESEEISNEGLQVSPGGNNFFYGKQKGRRFTGSGDLLTIVKEARQGNREAQIMFAIMLVAGIMMVFGPLFFAIIFLFINYYVSILLFIFDALAIFTIARNIYASYKRNKV